MVTFNIPPVLLLLARFLDGLHFCTKTTWFGGDPDAAYPAPFDKAFHVEIGLPVGGWGQSVESRAAAVDTSAMPKEMVIDYVRISQVRTHAMSF